MSEGPGAAAAFDERAYRQRGAVLLGITVGVLIAIGLLLDSVTHSPNRVVVRPRPVDGSALLPGVRDDFRRTVPNGLGTAPGGRVWDVISGGWSVESGRATARESTDEALALVGTGTSHGRIEGTIVHAAPGVGLAFRCGGPANCWRVEESSVGGTWNVTKVVGGRPSVVAHMQVPDSASTTVDIDVRGVDIRVAIGGSPLPALHDPDLARNTRIGLSCRSRSACAWTGIVMEPGLAPGLRELVDAPVRDDFDRVVADGLGTTSTGEQWKVHSGGWAVRDRSAILETRARRGPSIATVDPGAIGGTVEVGMRSVRSGVGLAFRCRDERNCWIVTASPGFATWNIDRIVDGRSTRVGNIGLSDTAAGTMVAVQSIGSEITVYVDGYSVWKHRDPVLADARGVGLAAAPGVDAALGRWSWVRWTSRSVRS